MTRTFSLGLVVALLLAFAVTEASRGRTNQVDGQKGQNRGSTRFYSNPTTDSSSSFSASSITASERSRHKSIRSETVSDIKNHEKHSARESSIGSRSKLKLSKTNDSADASSRTSARHLSISDDNSRNHLKPYAVQAPKENVTKGKHNENKENVYESQIPKRQTASRRIILDVPSVLENSRKLNLETFTKSPESRSKTGRKSHTNYNEKEAKDHVTPSRKLNIQNIENVVVKEKSPQSEHSKTIENVNSKTSISKKMDTINMNTSNNHNVTINERDVLLSESESVRVDIPLTEGGDVENAVPNILTSATISTVSVSPRQIARSAKEKAENNNIARSSAKKSRHSDRSKSRGRVKANDPNTETANLGNASRKRISSISAAETNVGRSSSNSRNRSKTKSVNSRGRSAQKFRDTAEGRSESRSRSRYANTDLGTNANGQTETRRNSANDRRTSDAKRRSGGDGRSIKVAETKIEEQDIRMQSRSRPRASSNLDVTTAYIPKATIAEATTVSSLVTEVTTSNSAFAATRAPVAARTSPSTDRTSRGKARDRGESTRSKKPAKEDFFNHGLGFRGRKSSTEGSSSNVVDLKSTTPKSETQLRGNPGWTLRRRPSHVNQETSSTTSTSINRDQTNEIISPNDSSRSTEVPLSNVKAGRRGTKRPKANQESSTVSGGAAKSVTRGSKTFNKSESFGLPKGVEAEESDNYPPAFRARLSQLKHSNVKPTTGKSSTRSSYQATKPSTAHLFSERSKLKLDLARRLIKPELNVDENDFDITTASYSDKSKAKEVSAVSESRNIEKTTKAIKPIEARAHGSLINESTLKEKYDARNRWKILGIRKSLSNRNFSVSPRPPATKKSQVITEKTIVPSLTEGTSMRNVIELNTISRETPISHRSAVSAEEMVATTIDTTKTRAPNSLNTTESQEESSTLANTMKATDEENSITTELIEPTKSTTKIPIEMIEVIEQGRDIYDAKKETTTTESTGILTTEFAQEVTLAPAITTASSTPLSPTIVTTFKTLYPVYIPNSNDDSSQSTEKTISSNDATKDSFRPRYTKQQSDKVAVSMMTSMTVGPTSRYIRKKSGIFTPYDAIPKPSTEAALTQTKRREFRPRTATYRRHSEVPTSVIQPAVTKEENNDITITPKPTKYHSSVKSTPSTRSLPTEPLVSVRIDASNEITPRVPGITDSSNGNSGSSNVFSPTRSTFLASNTTTLLEQLRSTVAPLLNTLGNKTPVFSGAYSNVDTGNSAPRITPNGSPPRFSARYKGAELFVRKPSLGQSMVPSITTSTTTASTPIENSSSSPSAVNVISPGEPRFLTFYQALESASIKNENLQVDDDSPQQRLTGGVTKVDSNATIPNGVSNDTANNDTASPAIVPNATTSSSDSSVDTTTTTQSADISLTSRLNTESTPDDSLATVSTTAQTPANSDTNEETTPFNVNTGETTPPPTSESIGITTPDNMISNTPPNNTDTPNISESPTTTETTNNDITMSIDITTETLPAAKSIPVNSLLAESANVNTETTEVAASTTQATNADVSTISTSQSSGATSDVQDTTTFSSVTESVTITQTLPEETTPPSFNDLSEDIETNTIQSSNDTTPQTTDTPIKNTSENARNDFTDRSDVTTTETTSTTEAPSTTETISTTVTESRTTPAPATTTFRPRLIDFAQDILSRLQSDFSSTTSTQDTVTTILPELASTISNSSSVNTETAQLTANVVTTTSSSLNTEATTVQGTVGTESTQATTGVTNGPQETTTQNIVGSDIASVTAQDQFNGRESNVRNTPDSSTMTGQRQPSIVDESNKSLDSESTTATDNTGNLENLPRNVIEVVTVTSMPISRDFIAENEPRSSNDTLLTELMTIAKTLFSEAMNDTRLEPNRISDLETTTVPGIYNSTQVNDTVESNEQSQLASSNDTLEATTIPFETSISLESTNERIDITTSVDFTGDENISRAPVVGSIISLMESNENPVDVGDITTVISQTQTSNAIKPVTSNTNSELIANMSDSLLSNQSSNNTERTTTSNLEFAQQSPFTTVPSVKLPDQSLDFTTNNPAVIDSVTPTEERILSDINESTTSSISDSELTELSTNAAVTEINNIQTDVVGTTNQILESTTTEPVSDLQVTNNRSLLTNASIVTTTLPAVFDTGSVIDTTDTSDNPSFSTELPTESVSNLISTTIDTTTNQFDDITTNVPDQTLTDLVSESPNFIARFQDTTATTAQGTAGSGIIQPAQTTETTVIPTSTTPLTTPMSTNPPTSPDSSTINTTPTSSSAVTETTTTMMTSTATFETTAEPMPEMTTPTVDIKENLISNETSTDSISTTQSTTVIPNESEDLNMISRADVGQEQATTTATITTSTAPSTSTPTTTTMSNTQTSTFERVAIPPKPVPAGPSNTGPYLGRFDGSQITPPRRLSSNKAPVRDYLIYGIYPNKTIVRKRPEDNLIDARNVDSPYVIFGIYPDGRLVRKFPNGTIIPDSPRNPVEVVFTLSTTTTTNRPAPRPYYNQANQAGPYNQYQVPAYYNNRRPVDELTRNVQSPGTVDFGLTGNAIGVPPGSGPYFPGPLGTPASVPSSNKMSDILLNTQMGTLPNAASTIGGNLQMPATSNARAPVGPIFQDRDRNEGSRTRVTSDQANSVYIGQDKFINYQIDGAPNVNPKVVDLKINSVATSVSEGPLSSSIPSFENLLSNQPGGVITAPPGFPWRDPLDQIFGITTNSPILTASVASNQLDESVENNASIVPRPINPFVEVFTPTASTISATNPDGRLRTSTSSPTSTSTTNNIPFSTTTTPLSTTVGRVATATFTTTPTPLSTTVGKVATATFTTTPTTTTTASTTTTTTTTTTTPIPTTAATSTASVSTTIIPETTTTIDQTTTTDFTPTIPRLATTASAIITKTVPSVTVNSGIASSSITTRSAIDMLNRLRTNRKENSFGTTFGDLAFLNSLLQNNIQTTTPKTLSEVEQLLANRILALALAKPGPTRSPKAIQNVASNIIDNSINSSPSPSSEPIIIDLLPYSSPSPPSWKSNVDSSTSTTKKYVVTSTIATTQQNIPITTTRAPIVITAKPVTTARPKTTTPRLGLGVSLWRALFGNNLETSTTKPKTTAKAVTPKLVQVTQKPTQTVKTTTSISHIMSATPVRHSTIRSVDISDILLPSAEIVADNINAASVPTLSTISTTQQTLLNNPNPRLRDVSASTFSPEDDAKFLLALLRSIQADSKPSTAATLTGITEDDEAFLRAILSNQASISTTSTPSSTDVNSAALIALLLKQQGIEPSTPAIKLREQLQLANLDLTTQSQPFSTTIRPVTNANRPPSPTPTARTVTKKVVTPKPTPKSKPPQATTWSPSSTYPPPLFGGTFGSSGGGNSGSGIVTATRAFGQLLGAAITGAAQQLQSLLRNGTRNVAG